MKMFISGLLLVLVAASSAAQSYEVYVSDAGNFDKPPWQILKFDANGENPSVFISSPLNWPQDILFLEDAGIVLISSLGSGKITKHDAETGAYLGDFATGIGGPTRMKIGPDGNLYVLQWVGNGRVRRYDLSGTYLGDFTNTGVPQSIGIDWDAEGNLYVSSYSQDHVRKYDSSGMDQGVFVASNLVGPTNIWFDDNGDLLVVDYDGTAVKRFDSSGNYLGDFIQGLRRAEGVGSLPDGHLLIGDGGSGTVKEFDDGGVFVRNFVRRGSGNLLIPNAVVVRALPTEIPDAPDGLTTTILGLTSRLRWHDNSDDEEGFRIYRRTSGGEREPIGSVAANVTAYSDATIETGVSYEYTVVSFIGDRESELSEVVAVTPECAGSTASVRAHPVRPGPQRCSSANAFRVTTSDSLR